MLAELKTLKNNIEMFEDQFENETEYPEEYINNMKDALDSAIGYIVNFDHETHEQGVREQNEIDAAEFRRG